MSRLVLFITIFCAILTLCASLSCKKSTLERKLSSTQRSEIVKIHNHLRRLLVKGAIKGQPRAAKMHRLKWDARLAKTAQKIANTCKFKHATVEDIRWWWVGQNLYKESSTAREKGLNVTSAVYGWFEEYRLYKYPHYKKESGHYTQVVWADSKYVGCGYTHYKKREGKFKYHKIFVCNYGPGGNVQGEVPYKRRS